MQVYRAIFGIVVAISLVLFLFQAVEGKMGDGRQCFYVGNCEYEDQVGFRYYQCFGSYAAYSHWEQDSRCRYPNEKPISVQKLFGY